MVSSSPPTSAVSPQPRRPAACSPSLSARIPPAVPVAAEQTPAPAFGSAQVGEEVELDLGVGVGFRLAVGVRVRASQ
jgi:hypothetical protein